MLLGHSGCHLEQTGNVVWKTAVDYPKDRLRLQAEKQSAFSRVLCCDLRVPKVHKIFRNCFSMEYIPSHSCLEFLDVAAPKDVDRFIAVMLEYFNKVATPQDYVDVIKLVREKLDEVASKVSVPEAVTTYVGSLKTCVVPLSPCLGDSTLSNFLFLPGFKQFYAVDLCDSFIDSLLIDVVKLRQDCRYHWTHHLHGLTPTARHRSILGYIDQRLISPLVSSFDPSSIKVIEILNYVRILPYCREERTTAWVNDVLCRLLAT